MFYINHYEMPWWISLVRKDNIMGFQGFVRQDYQAYRHDSKVTWSSYEAILVTHPGRIEFGVDTPSADMKPAVCAWPRMVVGRSIVFTY